MKATELFVLIPFISGLDCYVARGPVVRIREDVLIPFISGLDCYEALRRIQSGHPSLNPFYFRAGLLPCLSSGLAARGGLNPFYFRAGLLRRQGAAADDPEGLNPFYFRAGLLRARRNYRRSVCVLIPSISGLDCYRPGASRTSFECSLNPFYFRAGLLPRRMGIPREEGLNPFYFRAGLLHGRFYEQVEALS